MTHSFRGFYKSLSRTKNVNTGDDQYLKLVKRVLQKGEIKTSRNGDVLSTFGESMEFSLNNYKLPILTTKHMAWKTCLKELLWFISGSTDNDVLVKQNVKIWEGNADPAFKEKMGIFNTDDNDLGPIYGHQWRHFNAPYSGCNTDYGGEGVDQLQNIITTLENPVDKYSRRLLLSAWNPCQLSDMALPPCHVMFQLNVNNKDELSCVLYQRSADIALGVPFNIASYSFLITLLATHCGLKPGKFIHHIGDAHIYMDHIPHLKEQIKLKPYDSPFLLIKKKDDISDYVVEDFRLLNYISHPKIKMNMVA
jgi:thymidylate synthase